MKVYTSEAIHHGGKLNMKCEDCRYYNYDEGGCDYPDMPPCNEEDELHTLTEFICDGHRRWLDAEVVIDIAALEGVAQLNEY